MKKAILLAMILAFTTSAYALHEHENPDLQGNPITEETQTGTIPGGNLQKGAGDSYGSVTENPPPDEEPTIWEKMNPFNWFSDED